MAKLEIEVDDETFTTLRNVARDANRAPEDLAIEAIVEYLDGALLEGAPLDSLDGIPPGSDPSDVNDSLVRLTRPTPKPKSGWFRTPVPWSPSPSGGIYSHARPEAADAIEPDERFGVVDDPRPLPARRDRAVRRVVSFLDKRWVNGGLIARFYGLHMHRRPAGAPTRELALGVIDELAEDGLLPPEITGASIQHLAEDGIREVSLQTFGDSFYCALQGGAYSAITPDRKRLALTRSLLTALFGDKAEDSYGIFALATGFSNYFEGVYWDLAFLILDLDEGWILLICGTDTD